MRAKRFQPFTVWGLTLLFVVVGSLLVGILFNKRVEAQAADFPDFEFGGSEFQVSSNSLEERKPRVAYNSVDNEYLVVYDRVISSSNINVFARRFDADGNQLGSELTIVSGSTKEVQPDVGYSPVDNQYLVIYQRENSTYDIHGRVVTADGQMPNGGFLIANSKAGSTSVDDINPEIEYNSATNRFLIAFDSDLTGQGLNRKIDVAGIVVDTDGNPISSIFTIAGLTHDDETPSVAYNSTDDEFMVVYQSNTNNDGNYNVYATRLDGDGTVLTSAFAIQNSSVSEKYPNISYDSANNQYLVSSEYDENDDGSTFDIYYQKLSSTGSVLVNLEANTPSNPAGSNKIITRAAYNSANDSFLTVYETRSGSTTAVEGLGLQIDGTTTQRGPEVTIGTNTVTNDWHRPDVVYNTTNNEFFVVWSETLASNNSLNILGRVVTPASGCAYVTDIPQSECEALEDLYESTTGESWTTSTGWYDAFTNRSSDATACDWHGLLCAAGHVTRVQLTNNNLTGTIPASLSDLTELEWLRLYTNNLSGSIPSSLGSLEDLEILDIRYNDLTGSIPTELGNLSNLEYLRFHDNDLSGSIPASLGQLDNLIDLSLGMNDLSGSIPPELGDMSTLRILALYRNDLTGSIPADIGDLANLRYLGLYENDLSGSIPSELGQLSNLQTLALAGNSFSNSIPSSIWGLTNLVTIGLKDNNLSGTIPSDLTSLVNLDSFDVSGNSLLGGTITSSTFYQTLTTLDVSGTQIVVQ